VLVGIADTAATSARIEQVHGVNATMFEGFHIAGIEHEAMALGKSLDQYFQMLVEKIKSSALSEDLKGSLSRNIKMVRYYNKTVVVFDVEAQHDPSSYGGVFYIRHGAQLNEVAPADLANFIRRFDRGF
jgi:predicted HTH transcriptional regulator